MNTHDSKKKDFICPECNSVLSEVGDLLIAFGYKDVYICDNCENEFLINPICNSMIKLRLYEQD